MTWVLVPAKHLDRAKSRLAQALGDGARRALAAHMLDHVLSTVAGAPGVAALWVITDSADVRRLAAGHGARCLADPHPGGGPLRQVVDHGLRALRALGATRLAVLMGDLPALTQDDVSALLAPLDRHDAVLAPDGAGLGTNALAVNPPVPIATRFGDPHSFASHSRWLADAGVQVATVRRPGLDFDIDTPADASRYLGVSGAFTAAPLR